MIKQRIKLFHLTLLCFMIASCDQKELPFDCDTVDLPDAPTDAGQIVLSVHDSVDPCSISGYVVGYQDDLKVELANDGQLFVNNIPSGVHDIILGSFSLSTTENRWLRLGQLEFSAGVRNNIGEINIPVAGGLTGKVTLDGQSDHAGIQVYIPGTGFSATTNSSGAYTISPFAPVGKNNLYFEKEGYHRGQVEDISVLESTSLEIQEITLITSNDEKGFLLLDRGAESTTSKTVSVILGINSDATLMKISESNTFDRVSWTPIVSSTHYTFSSNGNKTLYVKFSDNNGVESEVFSDSINVDSPQLKFTASFDYSARSTTMIVNIDINDLPSISRMKIAPKGSLGSVGWVPFSASVTMDFAEDIEVQLQDELGVSTKVAEFHNNYIPLLSTGKYRGVTAVSNGIALVGGGIEFIPDRVSSLVEVYNGNTKMWSTTNLSEPRLMLAGTSVNELAIFAGGTDDYANFFPVDTVDIYNTTNGTWATANLSVARKNLAAASAGGKALFAGGFDNILPSNVVDIYDSETNTWSTSNLTEEVYLLAGTSVGNKVYFGGGYTRGSFTDLVSIFDVTNSQWSTANLSQARSLLTATSNGNLVFFAGGRFGQFLASDRVDILNTVNNTWSQAALSQARYSLASTSVGSYVIFAGGYTPYERSDRIDIYNTTTNNWTTDKLPMPVSHPMAFTVGSKAYVVGGAPQGSHCNNGRYCDLIYIFDSEKGTWSNRN